MQKAIGKQLNQDKNDKNDLNENLDYSNGHKMQSVTRNQLKSN